MIEKNLDRVGAGLARLIQQFKEKPRIIALLSSWLAESQAIEDAAFDLLLSRLIQAALAGGNIPDDLLDKIGKIVGQQRLGLTNDQYLVFITARIKSHRSGGKREDLIAIADLLVPDTPITVREYPGSVYITPLAFLTIPPAAMFDFLARAVAAGVLFVFVYLPEQPPAGTFQLSSIWDANTTDAGRGLGDSVAGLVGGELTCAISTGS